MNEGECATVASELQLLIERPLWLMGNRTRSRGEVDPNMHLLEEPLNTHPATWSSMHARTTVRVAYAKKSGEESDIVP